MRRIRTLQVVSKSRVSLYHALPGTVVELFFEVHIVSIVSLFAEDYGHCEYLDQDSDPEYGGISPVVRAAYKRLYGVSKDTT